MKNNRYAVLNYILLILALAVTILLLVKGDVGEGDRVRACLWTVIGAVLLQLQYLIHEVGHLVFGLISCFRPVSFTVGFLRLSRTGKKLSFLPHAAVAGACEMYPVGTTHLKTRVIAYTLGGALFNFLFSAAALILYFTLPANEGTLFLAALAPLNLYEGIAELIPAALNSGKTDGCLIKDLLQKEPAAMVTLAVFRAQGHIARGSFSSLPRDILYDVPVIREDEPAFISLLQLRMMKAALGEDREEALAAANRLSLLSEYLPAFEAGEIASDCASVLWAFGGEFDYIEHIEWAKGSCAHLRAQVLSGNRTLLPKWKKATKKLPMQGMREWENFFLSRLKDESVCAENK